MYCTWVTQSTFCTLKVEFLEFHPKREVAGCSRLNIPLFVYSEIFAITPKCWWWSGNTDAKLRRRCLKIGHIRVTRLDFLENRITTKTTFWHSERNSCEKCSNWIRFDLIEEIAWLKCIHIQTFVSVCFVWLFVFVLVFMCEMFGFEFRLLKHTRSLGNR